MAGRHEDNLPPIWFEKGFCLDTSLWRGRRGSINLHAGIICLCSVRTTALRSFIEKLEKLTHPETREVVWKGLRQLRRYKSTSYIAAVLSIAFISALRRWIMVLPCILNSGGLFFPVPYQSYKHLHSFCA